MLQRLYSHVAEAICFLLIIISPNKKCFKLFRVVGWVLAIMVMKLGNAVYFSSYFCALG